MCVQKVPVEQARETLERLYDEPETQIPELLERRPDDETIVSEYTVFQAVANEERLKLLEALRDGECSGCELMMILDAPQSTVATHLRKLRKAGLVKNRKKGRLNYYRIADAAIIDLLDLASIIEDQ